MYAVDTLFLLTFDVRLIDHPPLKAVGTGSEVGLCRTDHHGIHILVARVIETEVYELLAGIRCVGAHTCHCHDILSWLQPRRVYHTYGIGIVG